MQSVVDEREAGVVKNKWAVTIWVLLCLFLVFIVGSISAYSEQSNVYLTPEAGMIWTQWYADHYMLLDDEENMWVGTGSGLVRWDKATATHTRISTVDGLPHREVLAGAVDSAGNRWFGGDGGLSRLDKDENWTHYNTSNSGISHDFVDGIAVGVDGTLWLSHGDPAWHESSLKPDGSWMVYPNRKTAVAQNYETIKQSLNNNYLWAVAGDEVWVGYEVFNGSSWQYRTPAGSYSSPIVVVVDRQNRVWALEWELVFSWDGNQWQEYHLGCFRNAFKTMAVDEHAGVWVGGSCAESPYSNTTPNIWHLTDDPDGSSGFALTAPPPVTALLPTDAGIWSSGPNWLRQPDGTMTLFPDVPIGYVSQTIVDRQGTTWIINGALQIFDDMGTATMADDRGTILGTHSTTALEPAPNGDLWVGRIQYSSRVSPTALPPIRYHNYSEIAYPLVWGLIDDIFTQDAQHTWFTYRNYYVEEKGIHSLDDGGTPADYTDDVSALYPIETAGVGGIVAVKDGRLWYGDSSGLYQYGDPGWEQVSANHVHGLVPAADGSLFVDLDTAVLIIEPDGRQSYASIESLITNDLPRVRSTERRNRMWTVAPDGAVWYWRSSFEHELVRRGDGGIMVYTTPVRSEYVEVDKNNHVWLADGALWRMSPQPDFAVGVAPSLWMMSRNNIRNGTVKIDSIEEYIEAVQVTVEDLPSGVTAKIEPNPLLAGETVVLTLTTTGAALGNSFLTVSGTSASYKHSKPFELVVVEQVFDTLMPVVAKH